MKIPKLNWPLWAGFFLSMIAFLSYFFVFLRWPVTRDFPWVNLLLFALAALLLVIGLRRAFAKDRIKPVRSKIAGVVLTTLSVLILGFFVSITLIMARHLPTSKGAPQVGQKAPDFALADTSNKSVALTDLLAGRGANASTAPKGVLLIFYRGYW